MELTPEQLKMVETIVERYLEVMPQEKTSKKSQAPLIMAVASLVFCFIILLITMGSISSLNNYIYELDQNQQRAEQEMWHDMMIMESTISNRLETQLKAVLEDAYEVITDYGWDVIDHDLEKNTLTIAVFVDAKVYSEDTQAVFVVTSGRNEVKADAIRKDGRFSAEIVCPRSKSMELSLRLINNGVTEVKKLDTITDQFQVRFPDSYVIGGLALEHLPLENGVLRKEEYHLHMKKDPQLTGALGDEDIVEAELIYYVNEERYLSFELPVEIIDGKAQWELDFDLEIPLQEGDTIADVVCLIDRMGRQTRTIRSALKVQGGQLIPWGIVDEDYFMN